MLQRNPHRSGIFGYADQLSATLKDAQATDLYGKLTDIDEAVQGVAQAARRIHDSGNKLIFVGNGGSSAIASHMATDYSKNGNLRSCALNDAGMLTCLGNDFGYEHVFAKQIEFHGRKGDLLVAISSSGKSANILNAVAALRKIGGTVVTLSGGGADNPLRSRGDINLFLHSEFYGFVEIGHLALCHAILDFSIEQEGRGVASVIK